MEFSLFVGKGKNKNEAAYKEESIKDLHILPELKAEEREAFFRKIASLHVNGLDNRAMETIRKFTNTDNLDHRTLYMPEVIFQNKILEFVAADKIRDLSRFVSEYTKYFVEEKNKTKKNEIEPTEVKNVHEYIEKMMLGVEKVAEVVEEIDKDFQEREEYRGMNETIGTNNTLDVKHKIDLLEIISDPFSNEIPEVVLVQVKRGEISNEERLATEIAHQEYIASLDTYIEHQAFKDVDEIFAAVDQETIVEKRIQLLNTLHERYGYFGMRFCEENIRNLRNSGINDELISTYLLEVNADFSLDELAVLVKSRDAHEIFNIADEPRYNEHLELLEVWASQHRPNAEAIYKKIPLSNIARARNISSVVVDKNTSFAKAYKNRILLKKRGSLTVAA